MKSTLESVPEVRASVTKKLEAMSASERRAEQLESKVKGSLSISEDSRKASNRMKNDIENADTLSKLPDQKSQSKALDIYMGTLAREKTAGLISKEKYDASLKLISDANTLADKSATARRIASRIAGLGTAIFVGTEASKMVR